MKTLTLLLAAALVAGLAWAQPFRDNAERGPQRLHQAAQIQTHLHGEDGECDGVMKQTRNGQGNGGMEMLQRQAMDGHGGHPKGPKGQGHQRGVR